MEKHTQPEESKLHIPWLWGDWCAPSFMSIRHKLESFGKGESQLKKSSYQTGLWACLWDIFLIAD